MTSEDRNGAKETETREGPELTELRRRARSWFAENVPRTEAAATPEAADEDGAGSTASITLESAKDLHRRMHDAGLAGIAVPQEYGGQGGTAKEQRVVDEEAGRHELGAHFFQIGLGMCAPTILAHGTEGQKRRFLPSLLRGDEVWCQLFSEPGAGSDLASLRTRAARDGDVWTVTGQKVWTSGAQHSDWGIILTRTNPDVPKHQGLTMFIVDLHSPGVTVRPLRQMSGEAHFNEVFLDSVRIPAEHMVGGLDEGWKVATTTLLNERLAVSGRATTGRGTSADTLIDLARRAGRSSEPLVRQALADVWIRERVGRYLRLRLRAAVRAGRPPGPEASLTKLAGAALALRASSVAIAVAGPAVVAWDPTDERGGRWARRLNAAPGASIGGGTSEVLRNIVGERVLELPREPQVDRGVPFRDLLVGSTAPGFDGDAARE